jgi:translation initiation factor IF-3
MGVKANQARRFILRGDKVKFNVRFRGREMAHPDIGRKMLEQIAEQLRDITIVEQKPLMEGRVLSLLLAPTAKVLKAVQLAQKAQSQQPKVAKPAPTSGGDVSVAPQADDEELDDEELDDEELDDEELDDEELDDEELDDEELDDEELDDEELDGTKPK